MMDNMLERIRKLLAKAENPGCTTEEAAALNDKAAELIAKYGVDQALLSMTVPEADPVGDRVVAVPSPYALDKVGLLSTVAGALRCRSVRRKEYRYGSYEYTVHLFGCASDLERTELLFTSLLVQVSYGMAAATVPSWEAPAAYRRSWLAGFTQAVGHRLREAERRAQQDAGSTPRPSSGQPPGPSLALVLADRGAQVDQRVDEAYPRLRMSAPRRLAGTGMGRGYAAGQRADLGGVRVGARPRGSLAR